jgi:hypothetical protein
MVPVGEDIDDLTADVTCKSTEAVPVEPPAIDGIAMFESARGRNDHRNAPWPQDPHHLEHRHPEELDVLERLPRDQQVHRIGPDVTPRVRVVHHDVDVDPGFDVESSIAPDGIVEELHVGELLTVHHLATEVEDVERYAAGGREMHSHECLQGLM